MLRHDAPVISNTTKICNDLKQCLGRLVFSFDGGTKAKGNMECTQLPNILLKFLFVALKTTIFTKKQGERDNPRSQIFSLRHSMSYSQAV